MRAMLAVLLAASTLPAFAQGTHYVRPHVTRDGTYVQGHTQTNPDSSRQNNYSTQGNVNPYTGNMGTVNPYAPPSVPSYPSYQVPNYGAPQMPQMPCVGLYCK